MQAMAGRVTPRAPEVQRAVHDAQRMEIHTSLPARVVSYDRASQTIEAEFLVREVSPAREDEDDDTVAPYPNVVSVPVAGMRLGSLVIHADLQPGEEVWICFTEADLNRWRETGQISDPGVPTRHGLAGCWAQPGAFSRPNALTGLTDKPTIKVQGGASIVWNGAALEAGGSDDLVKSDPLKTHLAAIRADLATVFAAATAGTPTYSAPGFDAANPIATTITKGA
jgi:hypothetical protein